MSDIIDENNPNLDVDILSLYTGNKDVYLQNWEAVNRLELESDLLAKFIIGGTITSSILGLFSAINPFLSLSGVAISGILTQSDYLWRVRRLYLVAKSILDYFGDDNIVITPRVKTDSATIDLLVRMPDKRMFALMIRAADDSSIIWREDRQQFFATKKGKSAKRAGSLTKAIDQLQTISYLKKIKHPIVGVTSSERSAPIIKAIVLSPGAKILANDDSPLWTEFGQARVLKIQTTSITYLVQSEDLIKIMQSSKK
jgi:hypothetical protein